MELKPYHVGIIEYRCSHCGIGKVFAVLDDDGADILGMSWTDDEDSAQEMCDAMNVAYTNGYAQGNVNTRPAPSEEAVEELIKAYEAYIKVIEEGYGEILDTLPVDVDELAPSIKGERDNANKRIAKARAELKGRVNP